MTSLLRMDQWFLIALAINSRFPPLAHQALYDLVLAFSPALSLTFSSCDRFISISQIYTTLPSAVFLYSLCTPLKAVLSLSFDLNVSLSGNPSQLLDLVRSPGHRPPSQLCFLPGAHSILYLLA